MEISKIPTELRAKRTREQAGLDDAEAGNARKTAAKTWGLELRDLASATKGYMTRAQCKTDTVEALLALGACSAAAMRVTQTLGDIGTLRDWLFSRKQLTRAALRMWQHTQCPEECKKGENCTWRVAPGELDRTDGPRFVALDDANKAVDGFFQIGRAHV